jgi:hypothetical protein
MGMINQKVGAEGDAAYGTPEEIAARDKVAKPPPGPTQFVQISPEDNAGMNAAHPTRQDRSGRMKFSGGV